METLVPAQHSENEDEIDTHKKAHSGAQCPLHRKCQRIVAFIHKEVLQRIPAASSRVCGVT